MVKYYALTLTASPHKDKFKKLCWSAQEEQFQIFYKRFKLWFSNFQYTFEICETSKLIHSHLCISVNKEIEEQLQLTTREIIQILCDSFKYKFGYDKNPDSYSYLIKKINTQRDYDIWEEYMYKTYKVSF